MTPLWLLCVSLLPLLVKTYSCTPQLISTHYIPEVLQSLQCYNDYHTHVHCTWEEPNSQPNPTLYLYFGDTQAQSECECKGSGHSGGLVNCRCNTGRFGIGTNHTFFFKTLCPPALGLLSLSQHLKVRPPRNLTVTSSSDGNYLLRWESPYPPDSPLTTTLKYQLSFRHHGQDWAVIDNLTVTEALIDRQSVFPGRGCEARVRARGSQHLWSDWSPLLTWRTNDGLSVSGVECELEGESVGTCRWKVIKEHAQFHTYHLCCSTNTTHLDCQCCRDVHVTVDESVLEFSCSVFSAHPEQLKISLVPMYNSKTFQSSKHIQPSTPELWVSKGENGDWFLNWTQPRFNFPVNTIYELCYWSNDTEEEHELECKNLPASDLSTIILADSLIPSRHYQAKLRALPSPHQAPYAGIPSHWSRTVHWTSHPAPFSTKVTTLYTVIAVLVAVIFIILYYSLPACHRRVELWKVSIPSPIKSKVLEEIQKRSSSGLKYQPTESESICTVQTPDIKNRSFEDPLWPCSVDDDDEDRLISKQEVPDEPNHSSCSTGGKSEGGVSGMSFSGPYIYCMNQSDLSTDPQSPENPAFSSEVSAPREFGYVFLPPNPLPSGHDPIQPSEQANRNTNDSSTVLGSDDTLVPTPVVQTLQTGYCSMPSLNGGWVHSSTAPAGGSSERQPEHSGQRAYVTLSQNEC